MKHVLQKAAEDLFPDDEGKQDAFMEKVVAGEIGTPGDITQTVIKASQGDKQAMDELRRGMEESEHSFLPADEPSDLDQNNPVDMSAEAWTDTYGKMDDPEGHLDHDHGMDE